MLIHCPLSSLHRLSLPTAHQGGHWGQTQPHPSLGAMWGVCGAWPQHPILWIWLTFSPHYNNWGADLFPNPEPILCSSIFLTNYPIPLCKNPKSLSDNKQDIYHPQDHALFLLITRPYHPHGMESFPWIPTLCLGSATVKTLSRCPACFSGSSSTSRIPSGMLCSPVTRPISTFNFHLPDSPLASCHTELLNTWASPYVLRVPCSSCLMFSPIPEQNEWISFFCVVSFLFTHTGNCL